MGNECRPYWQFTSFHFYFDCQPVRNFEPLIGTAFLHVKELAGVFHSIHGTLKLFIRYYKPPPLAAPITFFPFLYILASFCPKLRPALLR